MWNSSVHSPSQLIDITEPLFWGSHLQESGFLGRRGEIPINIPLLKCWNKPRLEKQQRSFTLEQSP